DSTSLMFSPTNRKERENAGKMKTLITERQMNDFKPEQELVTHSVRLLRPEQFLRECDDVLLYRDGAPVQWLEQTLPDVLLAELKLHRRPLSTKTCVVTDPEPLAGLRDLQVIRRCDPFDPGHLQPFFSPMQTP